jgi:hypothetical protein
VLIALLGGGCSGDSEAQAEGDAPYAPVDPDGFEVGGGSSSFRALGPDAMVTVVAGSQGGYHIWLSIRCGGCGPDVIITYGVDDASTGELLTYEGLREWMRLEEKDGWRQAVGLIGVLSAGDPSIHVGREVRLWASVDEEKSDAPPLEGAAEATVSGIEY